MDFARYRHQLLQRSEGQVELWQWVRNFSQWFFDLLRNFFLVGVLKFFYEKGGGAVLYYVHQFALVVMLFYCLSYADQWYVNLFGFLDNKRLAHRLNRAVNFGIAVALFLAILWAASVIVAEISRARFEKTSAAPSALRRRPSANP